MQIIREIEPLLIKQFFKGKAIILIGARQVGKTNVIQKILNKKENTLFFDGDDSLTRTLLNNPSFEVLKSLIGDHRVIFIDEAQRIENIGLTSKMIVDRMKDKQLIISGSSSFEITNSINESLTGRKWEYILYPINWFELEKTYGYFKALQQLDLRLIYGMYPEIITHPSEEIARLKQLLDSYLYRDLLAFTNIKKPDVLNKLVEALAYQIGNEFSLNELSQIVKADKNTVANYMQILEKGFIIFTLSGYNKNLRNELKFAKKVYFWDNGIRNMVIGNFNPIETRHDKGALWENFLISERLKRNNLRHPLAKSYFWRTTSQIEIDYLEVENDSLSAFEIKWNEQAKIKKFDSFKNAYQTDVQLINKSNFKDFLS
jgi:predicted AAA+ superfamily ATPase